MDRSAWLALLLCLAATIASAQTLPKSSGIQRQHVTMDTLPPPKSDRHGHPPDTRKGTAPCDSPKLAALPDCRGSGQSTGSNPGQPRGRGGNDGNPGQPRVTGGNDGDPGQPPVTVTGGRVRLWPVGFGYGLFERVPIDTLSPPAAQQVDRELDRNGPQFPATLRMANFRVTGFVKARWPVVVDYEAEPGAYVLLTVVTQDAPPGRAVLSSTQPGRRIQLLRLPAEFGTGLKPATFSIDAMVSATNSEPRYLRIYGFGAGDRAVGSVAIDELRFGPQTVSRADLETHFGFHTHTTFDKMKAEFMQTAMVDGSIEGQLFDNKKIDRRVVEGESLNDKWNAKKAQPGPIQFRVRGWMTVHGDQGGDWVSAFSPDLVLKQ